jgi:predicted ATPase
LLAELSCRGHAVIEEPGRRIVAREIETGGHALPWDDAAAFARQAITLSLADRAGAERCSGWVFFDRALVDAAAALEHLTNERAVDQLCHVHRYNRHVFLAPPWSEIYEQDQERRHSFAEAEAEYERLRALYPRLGYEIHILSKISVESRADFVLATLSALTRS